MRYRIDTRLFNFYDDKSNFPPYDLIYRGKNKYTLELAVAGYDINGIDITVKDNDLLINSKDILRAGYERVDDCYDKPIEGTHIRYIQEGIKKADWYKRFKLTEHVRVKHASVKNGILTIELLYEVPEEEKPQKIQIQDLN